MSKKIIAHFSPARFIVLSFFCLISLGTLLLSLSISQIKPVPFIDVLFTATSATCITGLFTVPMFHFTRFGQVIIVLLMQLGAFGLATISFFILSLFIDLGLATKLMAGRMLELKAWQNIKRILLFIIGTTLVFEILGAIALFFVFNNMYSQYDAYFYAIFHSISSFCNAGVSFFHDVSEHHLEHLNKNVSFLFISSILMFSGGFGFITWRELLLSLHKKFQGKKYRFSLQTKIVFYGSFSLLVSSCVLFWILEYDNTLQKMNFLELVANTLFHAISFKSCGFVTTDLFSFNAATILFMLIIGFIGSAPASTGSGIRLTTFIIYLNTIKSAILGRHSVEILGRQITTDQVYKSIAIVSLSLGWIFLTTFCLLVTEQGWDFFSVLCEVTTSFTNVGLSLGGTNKLSTIGKLFILITMCIGRIGSLTLVLGLKMAQQKELAEFSYPEERVMLG